MITPLLYFAAGILGLLHYAAVLQLFRIARVLEAIRDKPVEPVEPVEPDSYKPRFNIKGGKQ